MSYYLLSKATDEKIIGNSYPQCKGIPAEMGLTFKWFEQPNSMTKLNNEEFPDFKPELIFELEEEAILTDVVSPTNISAKGLLINEKVKTLFEGFNLMEHKFYDASLFVRGRNMQYYWLHFRENNEQLFKVIDLQKTTFYIGNLARWKESDVNIPSIEDYNKLKQSIGFKTINFQSLCVTKHFKQQSLDLFYLNSFHNDFIITERLKKKLQALNVSGLEVRKLSFAIE